MRAPPLACAATPSRARGWATLACPHAQVVLDAADKPRHSVQSKGSAADLVTDTDRASEEAILAAIQRACPSHAILGEEGGVYVSQRARACPGRGGRGTLMCMCVHALGVAAARGGGEEGHAAGCLQRQRADGWG